MIKKEFYKTREDGVKLYRTFSDTDHRILNKRNGYVYDVAIDVREDEAYEEVDERVRMNGANDYDEVVKTQKSIDKEQRRLAKKINYIGLTDNEALSVKECYPKWESKVNSTIEAGYITLYDDNLWRARQTHTALEIYPPSINTASLYEVVVMTHDGTIEDPIPYTPPMEIFEGKYYTQFDVLYKCTRDSGTALTHDLFDLRGIYVELIER